MACPLCLKEFEQADDVISPCSCPSHVHEECFKRYRKRFIGTDNYLVCQRCNTRYRLDASTESILHKRYMFLNRHYRFILILYGFGMFPILGLSFLLGRTINRFDDSPVCDSNDNHSWYPEHCKTMSFIDSPFYMFVINNVLIYFIISSIFAIFVFLKLQKNKIKKKNSFNGKHLSGLMLFHIFAFTLSSYLDCRCQISSYITGLYMICFECLIIWKILFYKKVNHNVNIDVEEPADSPFSIQGGDDL